MMNRLSDHSKKIFSEDLDRLVALTDSLRRTFGEAASENLSPYARTKQKTRFAASYQKWYSEVYLFFRQVIPDRIHEFETLYLGDPKRKHIDADSYAIRDWLLGRRLSERNATGRTESRIVIEKFRLQSDILESARIMFETSLVDIDHLLYTANLDPKSLDLKEMLRKEFFKGLGAANNIYHNLMNVDMPDPEKDPDIYLREYDKPPNY